jgi:hypothetical protein
MNVFSWHRPQTVDEAVRRELPRRRRRGGASRLLSTLLCDPVRARVAPRASFVFVSFLEEEGVLSRGRAPPRE